jgi:hypothetical protein
MTSVLETASILRLRDRRQLERDLHDGAQQRLVSLALTLRMPQDKLDSEPGAARRLLDRSRDELNAAVLSRRGLAALRVAALVAASRLVPESRAERAQAFDFTGVGLVTAALLLLLYPLVQGRELDWSTWTFVSIAASVPAGAPFAWQCRGRFGVQSAVRRLEPLSEAVWKGLEANA